MLHWLRHTDDVKLVCLEQADDNGPRRILFNSSTINDGDALSLLLAFASSIILDESMKTASVLRWVKVEWDGVLSYFSDISCVLSRDDGRGRRNLAECCSSDMIRTVLVPCLLKAYTLVDGQPNAARVNLFR